MPASPSPVRIATPDDLDEVVAELKAADRVALDTEFHAERRYRPRLYLVQVQVPGGGTWLLDPLVPGVLEGVAPALVSVPWLVHGGAHDLALLLPTLGALPDEVLDTQIASALLQPDWPVPYARLVERHLGVPLSKAATLSDWSRRPLSQEQVRYAAADVQLLPPLWEALEGELDERGRLALARAACEEARQRALDPPAVDLAWRETGGARWLTAQQAAVYQELVAWREEVARAEDQPPRLVLSEGLLRDLCRRQPTTVAALAADRRMPRAVVKRRGPDLVERIARAARRPEWAWPRAVTRGSTEERAVSWLRCAAETWAHSQGFGVGLLLPDTLLEDLVLQPPATREALAEHLGWREALVGEPLWRALHGQVVLRLVDGVPVAEG